MRLDLATYEVKDLRFGPRTALRDRVLEIEREELRSVVCREAAVQDVSVELARPGEPVRIAHIMDSVEPRVRLTSSPSDFPGFLSPSTTVGEGRTNRLAGVAVMESAVVPVTLGGLNVKEAFLDMSGPAASLSPFARTLNIVLVFKLREGLTYRDYDGAIRNAGLRAAVYLAEASRELPPDHEERFELTPGDPGLPRVAYVCLLMHEGDVHHMFLYGRPVDDTPTLLHPNEIFDGALVSGANHSAGNRNPTYMIQNHAAIRELYRRHSRDLTFAGVIPAKALGVSFFDKQRTASYAAKLARFLRADGVVITAGSGGHGVADLMLTCQEVERAGLKTALTCAEMAGEHGTDFSFVTFVPEADAVVSTGNLDEVIELPPIERVIGGDTVIDIGGYEGGGGLPTRGRIRTSHRRIYCCSTLLGAGHLAARVTAGGGRWCLLPWK